MATFGSGDDGAERTEDPTPKRREEARAEGKNPRSQELSAAVTILAAAMLLAYAGGSAMGNRSTELLGAMARHLTAETFTEVGATEIIREAAQSFFLAIAPFLAGLGGAALVVGLIQGRGVISTAPLEPKLSHLDPVAGLGRIFSLRSPFVLFKSLAKFLILGLVSYVCLHRAWPEIVALSASSPAEVLTVIRALSFRLALSTGIAFLGIAAADYGFEVYQYQRSLRMTKQEVLREHKESEGNPLIKSRIRALAQSLARKRMLGDVKHADVVVVNPTHIAVALKYDMNSGGAPVVVAMGQRKLAERIKAIARAEGVPTVENRSLARALLATAKVGRAIPGDLYAAVAEVLAFVYRQRGWRSA
jgi:flagellar biosynthesis protein FlhB